MLPNADVSVGPTDIEPAPFDHEAWLEALRHIGQHYRLPISAQSVRQAAQWDRNDNEREKIRSLARKAGLRVKFTTPRELRLTSWHLPLIVRTGADEVAVVTALSSSGEATITFSGNGGLEWSLPLEELMEAVELVAIARPARQIPDARVDAYIRPYDRHWLRELVLRDLRPYGHVMVASLIANLLGLAGILFSMQVYDRVVPAESFPTLYVLFSGVLLAIGLDFIMRRLRTGIIDVLGKRADLRISDRVFGHALRIRNRARPSSTGAFIAQLRDLDQVRELMTSTTVAMLADVPFFVLFLVLFWHIGGVLVLVPIAALILLVTPGFFVQRRLRAYSNEAMREASLRNAMLVEAVSGMEDIKTLQAEERFQQQWNHLNQVTSEAQLKQRGLGNALSLWANNVQTGTYALTIFVGAPMVISGDITTGALVACSVLGSRMIAPMAGLSQIMGRMQQAKVAMESLDRLMQMPVDHPETENRIQCPRVSGNYQLRSAVFRYGDDRSPAALQVRDLRIRSGERIAVLGKNGAGKSTLLQALSGLLEPSAGEVLLDNLTLSQIDPADVRRDVGLLTQNARLFYGTIRDNITLGYPQASEEEILAALAMVGADEFVRKLPKGLEHIVMEGGHGLSGGQRQSLLLARLLIRQPTVLLLDEPTASMDEMTERLFIRQFLNWSAGRTVLIATHRMRVLEMVDRLMVIENGQVALDESKENGLKTLRGLAGVKTGRAP